MAEAANNLDASMRRTHIAVLASIAVCAGVSGVQTGVTPEPAPDPFFVSLAIALAVATVFSRQAGASPVAAPRVRVTFTLIAYGCATALAIVGAWLAISRGAVWTGLGFSVGVGILIARPPPPIVRADG